MSFSNWDRQTPQVESRSEAHQEMALSKWDRQMAHAEKSKMSELKQWLEAAEQALLAQDENLHLKCVDLELLREQAAAMLLKEQRNLQEVKTHCATSLREARRFVEYIILCHGDFEAQCVSVHNTLEKMRVAVESSNRTREEHRRLVKCHIKLEAKHAALEINMAQLKSQANNLDKERLEQTTKIKGLERELSQAEEFRRRWRTEYAELQSHQKSHEVLRSELQGRISKAGDDLAAVLDRCEQLQEAANQALQLSDENEKYKAANHRLEKNRAAVEDELIEEKRLHENLHQHVEKLFAAHANLCNEHEGLETKYHNIAEKGKHFQGQREEILTEREKRMLEAEQRMEEKEHKLMEREKRLEERRAEDEAALRAREARNAEMESGLAALVRGEPEARRCAEELEEKRAEAARVKWEAARLARDVADLRKQIAESERKQHAMEAPAAGDSKIAKRKVREVSAEVEERVAKRAKEEYRKGWAEGKKAGKERAKRAFAKELEEGSYWEECAVCMNKVTWPYLPRPAPYAMPATDIACAAASPPTAASSPAGIRSVSSRLCLRVPDATLQPDIASWRQAPTPLAPPRTAGSAPSAAPTSSAAAPSSAGQARHDRRVSNEVLAFTLRSGCRHGRIQ
eukprot:3294785-Rhodomonas_salina.1